MQCFCLWLAVQILLESFPVSSSGHCSLLEQYLQKYGYQINHYQDFFLHNKATSLLRVAILDHFVHGVTVVVIAVFFFSRWSWLLRNIWLCWRIVVKIVGLAICADLITVLFYLVFGWYKVAIPVVIGFFITGLSLISLRFVPRAPFAPLSWQKACVLGVVQGFALLPGISRFAATYVCARWLALSPYKAFEVSWLIDWPLIAAAFLHSAGLIIVTAPESLLLRPTILAVMSIAGIVSFYAFRCVAHLAYEEKLFWFGVYMIIPIIVALLI